MSKDTHMLVEIDNLHMKEKDRPNFNFIPYSNLIITCKYIINESKIFYLYSNKPLDAGILDMEELAEIPGNEKENTQQKKFKCGPITFDGSDQFMIIYNMNNSFTYN